MQETLTPTEEEFARAVRANNYKEIQLSPGLVLITDWEEDEEFRPWIAVENTELTEEDVEDLMDTELFDYDELRIEEQNGISFHFGEFDGVEFNHWAQDVAGDS